MYSIQATPPYNDICLLIGAIISAAIVVFTG